MTAMSKGKTLLMFPSVEARSPGTITICVCDQAIAPEARNARTKRQQKGSRQSDGFKVFIQALESNFLKPGRYKKSYRPGRPGSEAVLN